MKKTLGTTEAVNLLMADDNANWSREAAEAIIEHLEQMEEDCGTEIEFDRVAIRCDWNEYARAKDAALDYSWTLPERDEDESDEDYHDRTERDALKYLIDETIVLFCGSESTDGVVVQCF
jgi:hypothetical protein